jgi:hypothetical protein
MELDGLFLCKLFFLSSFFRVLVADETLQETHRTCNPAIVAH